MHTVAYCQIAALLCSWWNVCCFQGESGLSVSADSIKVTGVTADGDALIFTITSQKVPPPLMPINLLYLQSHPVSTHLLIIPFSHTHVSLFPVCLVKQWCWGLCLPHVWGLWVAAAESVQSRGCVWTSGDHSQCIITFMAALNIQIIWSGNGLSHNPGPDVCFKDHKYHPDYNKRGNVYLQHKSWVECDVKSCLLYFW